MEVYRDLTEYRKGVNTVATIGTFDGVHIGHQKILNRVIEAAKAMEGESVLISFYPHPRLVLFPNNNPLRLLQTLEEKIEQLERIGIDKLLLIPFSRSFSRTSSDVFIKDILVRQVGIKKLVIGYDHHFGKNRTGDITELRRYAPSLGYEVEEIPAQAIDNANVSSTKIRNALRIGDVEVANRFLSYAYSISGDVIHGQKMGRKLGFPTANIRPSDKWKLIPANGIYLVKVKHRANRYFGLLNIGNKPTVGDFPVGLEVYIYDFDQEIYGETLTVELLHYIREEKKFHSLNELVHAMEHDKQVGLRLIEQLSH